MIGFFRKLLYIILFLFFFYGCDISFHNPFFNNYSDKEHGDTLTPVPTLIQSSTEPTPESTPEPASTQNIWTWISGSNSGGESGFYGTKGMASGSNIPGARQDSISWIDSTGNLWLFGGIGYDKAGANGIINDLWKYDGIYWTWVSGGDTRDQSGIYGTKGVPNVSNIPGARQGSISWIDSSGNLWLFGGYGLDTGTTKDQLNDLWRYDGTYWTWVSGGNTGGNDGIYGTQGIPDDENIPGARQDSVAWIDSTGNLWLFGGFGFDSTGSSGRLNDLWKYDGTYWTWVSGSNTINHSGVYGTKGFAAGSNTPGTRRYSTGWIDSDDNLWLFGGSGEDSAGDNGHLNDLWKYDGTYWTWISGSNLWCESGSYGIKGEADNSNIPGARYYSVCRIDTDNNLWLFGGYGYDSTGTKANLNDLWKFDGTDWTWVSGSNTGDQTGTYGAKGVPALTNIPGARYSSIVWMDTEDNIWLFGGYGYDNSTSKDKLNDLWEYEP
ncbi:MAG: hypothetical protein JXB88_14700 [Spirochaetales bacterium]|nr:hypothetical protein [Spirochaetales bacterium]